MGSDASRRFRHFPPRRHPVDVTAPHTLLRLRRPLHRPSKCDGLPPRRLQRRLGHRHRPLGRPSSQRQPHCPASPLASPLASSGARRTAQRRQTGVRGSWRIRRNHHLERLLGRQERERIPRQLRRHLRRHILPQPHCGSAQQHPPDQRPVRPQHLPPRRRAVPMRRMRGRPGGLPLRRPRPSAAPAMHPAPPIRHRRRTARTPRTRPRTATRRQVEPGIAQRIAAAPPAGHATGSTPSRPHRVKRSGGRLRRGGVRRGGRQLQGVHGHNYFATPILHRSPATRAKVAMR